MTVGVSLGAIGNWESETRLPSGEMLVKLADTYGVTVDYLLGREEAIAGWEEGMEQCVEVLRTRPELVPLVSLMKDASPEDVRRVIRVVEAMML